MLQNKRDLRVATLRAISAFRKPNWEKQVPAVLLLCAAAAIALPAQTFTTLHKFCSQSGCKDGQNPYAGLVQGPNGNLYGTTFLGGGGAEGDDGYGTVFTITPSGELTKLYSFCPQTGCLDGAGPTAALVLGANGNFYGTTFGGGADGGGNVFEITPSGKMTTIYNFCSQNNCSDGSTPRAALVQGADGDFYGTTYQGGAAGGGFGTVFKMTPSGKLTTLYTFCAQFYPSECRDGADPLGALVQATNGDFYGTTYGGGAYGQGTVFKITPRGKLTTLYSFCSQSGCPDGQGPFAGLVQGTSGDFYGTTTSDFGAGPNRGTVFKITSSGKLTTLYSFCSQSGCSDGYAAEGGLVLATDGDFYGTTADGGYSNATDCSLGCGTVFKITAGGKLTTLRRFNGTNGANPIAGLFQATDGDFYGTTSAYGINSVAGTVFRLSVGLSPFVETIPTSGKVDSPVTILGTNLSGTTSITFNGISATFVPLSDSELTTTVPAGATSGTVQVVTPGGTLSSNVPFRVLP
jgi:uncharacterized repeat protein (TIGR03803 family)